MLKFIDKAGTILSSLCAIHCAIMPFILGLLPFLGMSFLADHDVEKIVLILAGVIATISSCWGFIIHKKWYIPVLFATAILIMLISHLWHHSHDLWSWRTLLMPLGGIILVTGHILNRKLCNTCQKCHH